MSKVSVVIPTKNEERHLPGLLDSLDAQTVRKDVEIVVVDAASTDRTREIALARGCRVVEGGPLPIGRNNGARAAGSDLLCFVDADILLPHGGYLREAVDEFERRGLDVAGVRVRPAKTECNLKDVLYGALYGISNVGIALAEKTRKPFMQCLIFMKREALDAVGGFPPYEFGEDSAFAQKAAGLGFRFGLLHVRPAVISPRRLEKTGFFRMALTYAYFNGWRMMGREFPIGGAQRYY